MDYYELPWPECPPHLPLLWHLPSDLLPLEEALQSAAPGELLEDRPRQPHRLRQPRVSLALVEAVLRLREKYPCWGKDKLALLLQRGQAGGSVRVLGVDETVVRVRGKTTLLGSFGDGES